MKIPMLLTGFILLCNHFSYGQSKVKRKPLKPIQLEAIDPLSLHNGDVKACPPIFFEPIADGLPQRQFIIIDCRPVPKSPPKKIYDNSYVSIDRTPRRDISTMVLMDGGVIEKLDGGFSILGSRNEPLFFVDGVKTRGNPTLPAATVSEVTVIKGGIPAELGDCNSGVILISSLR